MGFLGTHSLLCRPREKGWVLEEKKQERWEQGETEGQDYVLPALW